MNIKEATQHWVRGFNCYHSDLLEKAYPYMEGLEEITPVQMKHECNECHEEFYDDYMNSDEVELNEFEEPICPSCKEEGNDEGVIVTEEDYDNQPYGLPMWGYLWNPDEGLDEGWIRENLELVRDLGFRIYESEEIGILLGIDGAGYDFYEAHWISLYKAIGLRWHDDREEETA